MTRRWYHLRHLAEATGVPRRTLKGWADDGRLPCTRFAGGSTWRLFGADAIDTLESMGIPVSLAVLTESSVQTESTKEAPDDESEDD